MRDSPQFTVVLRGYDPGQTDWLVQCCHDALAAPPGDPSRETAVEALRTATPRVRFRGYDRTEVDSYLDELATELARRA